MSSTVLTHRYNKHFSLAESLLVNKRRCAMLCQHKSELRRNLCLLEGLCCRAYFWYLLSPTSELKTQFLSIDFDNLIKSLHLPMFEKFKLSTTNARVFDRTSVFVTTKANVGITKKKHSTGSWYLIEWSRAEAVKINKNTHTHTHLQAINFL